MNFDLLSTPRWTGRQSAEEWKPADVEKIEIRDKDEEKSLTESVWCVGWFLKMWDEERQLNDEITSLANEVFGH